MGLMYKYERHIERRRSQEDAECVIEVVETAKYTSVEELMLRGNNRKNTYSRERVRISSNDTTRKYNGYKR